MASPNESEYYCFICKKAITEAEYSYSKRFFKMALCRDHQEIQRKIKENAKADIPDGKEDSNVNFKQSDTPIQNVSVPEQEDPLIQWLTQWVVVRPINQPLSAKHFFVDGMRLEEFARDVIAKARDEILVTSPFLDNCFLVAALQEARDKRVNVKIIARRPTKDKTDLPKLECQAYLRKRGVGIHYINTIHSKIIVIDQKIAVLSSMNLYSGSTGGGLLEAGIVTYEDKVVASIRKYITDLLDKPESPDIANVSSQNYYRTRRF